MGDNIRTKKEKKPPIGGVAQNPTLKYGVNSKTDFYLDFALMWLNRVPATYVVRSAAKSSQEINLGSVEGK